MVINDKEKYNQVKSTISMKNIKRLINKENSLVKLAMQSGVSVSTINGYISGNRYPSVTTLVAMADYLKCSTDFLLGRTTIPIRNDKLNSLDGNLELSVLLNQITSLSEEKQKLVSAYVNGLTDQ